jgi:hypothetical protein
VEIHLYQLKNLSDISLFWKSAEADGLGFLHDDTQLVWPSVLALGYNPWTCQIRLIGKSNSNVYGIWLLGKKKGDNAHSIFTSTPPSFVMKVNSNSADFIHEELVLQKSRPAFFLRSWSWEQETMSALQPSEFPFETENYEAVASSLEFVNKNIQTLGSDCWWSWPYDTVMRKYPDSNGGVIVMRYICPMMNAPYELDFQKIIEQCHESLQCLYRNQITHCDIRPSNIGQLLLRDLNGSLIKQWVVFDFGNAAFSDVPQTLNISAQLSKYYPLTISLKNGSHPFLWTAEHDFSMLQHSVNLYLQAMLRRIM